MATTANFFSLLFIVQLSFSMNLAVPSFDEAIQFATKFYQAVRDDHPEENIVLSPLSVRAALGMLLLGAEGKTADELLKGINVPATEKTRVAAYFEQLNSQLDEDVVKVANRIFVKSGYLLKPQVNEILLKSFKSEAQNLDFSDNTKAANTINSWVKEKTNSKIQELFEPSNFGDDTRLVVANAVSFKGLWKEEFNKSYTFKSDFWITETVSVKVDMMYKSLRLPFMYIKEFKSFFILVPYKDSDISLLLIVPQSRTGLDELERKIENYDFKNSPGELKEQKIDLFLPKFEVETTVNLREALTKLGMGTIFTQNADFSNLLQTDEPLHVGSAIHKTYLKVDEEGTEAQASTGLGVQLTSMPLQVKVDHPFFFAILGRNDVPFIGAIRRP